MIRAILVIFLLAIVIHWLPNKGIPLHSDVTWYFRMQVEDGRAESGYPPWMKDIGAYPDSIFANFGKWYQLTGRYNILDFALFRSLATIAGDNADLWRLFYVLLMATSVGFFYLISKELGITGKVRILLVLALLLWPLGPWTDYKTSEPKALLALMGAYFLTVRSKKMLVNLVSAFLILAAVLIKETFLVGYILIPFLIFWRNLNARKILFDLAPYIFSFFLFLGYFLGVRFVLGTVEGGYRNLNQGLGENMFTYFLYNNINLLPVFANSWLKLIILESMTIFLVSISGIKITKTIWYRIRSQWVIICGLLMTIFFYELVYFLTNQELFDRYLIPGNFLAAFLFGLLITLLFLRLRPTWQKVFFGSILILMIPTVGTLVKNRAQNRIDQQAWQSLISQVKEAPVAAHVVLEFDDPFMIETAQSLEANTIMAGRSDLTYHLNVGGYSDSVQREDFVNKLIELFNLEREPIISDTEILYIKADRKGGDGTAYLNYRVIWQTLHE